MKKEHLPIFGVGPIIILPQIIITIIGVILTEKGILLDWSFGILKIPLLILGVASVVCGILMFYGAVFKARIDRKIKENTLVTDGVYGIVRNPIYSAYYLVCLGVVLIENNYILFLVPILGYVYMTIILKNTEEKWLYTLYGEKYKEYCDKVNRCIPIIKIGKGRN